MQLLLLLSVSSCSLGSREVTDWPSASPGCYQCTFAMLGNEDTNWLFPGGLNGTMELLSGNHKKPSDHK